MENFDLLDDEVILLETFAKDEQFKGKLKLTITTVKIVVEQEKGILKKTYNLLEQIPLEKIKLYNNKPQIIANGNMVNVQSSIKNLNLKFDGKKEAKEFEKKGIEAFTKTTMFQRIVDGIKKTTCAVTEVVEAVDKTTLAGKVAKIANVILKKKDKNSK